MCTHMFSGECISVCAMHSLSEVEVHLVLKKNVVSFSSYLVVCVQVLCDNRETESLGNHLRQMASG